MGFWLRKRERHTDWQGYISLQVLDFYKRLSTALGETLANADDMQEDGGRLQQVIVIVIVIVIVC